MGCGVRGGWAGLGQRRRRRNLGLGLFGLLAACLWTGVVRSGWSDLLSNPLDRAVRSVHGPGLYHIDQGLSLLGTPAVSVALAMVLCSLIARRDRQQGAAVLIAFGLGLLAEAALKRWLFYPAYGSYPSGHALRALLLALVAGRYVRRRSLAIGLIGVAIAVGLSRISSGDHFSDEVLGAWLLGWSLALLTSAAPRQATATPSALGERGALTPR